MVVLQSNPSAGTQRGLCFPVPGHASTLLPDIWSVHHRWQDDQERSWEPAANVGPEVVAAWEAAQSQKGQQLRTGASASRSDAAADRLRRSQVCAACPVKGMVL